MKYVVIGSSAAGINAIEELRKCDSKAQIDVVSSENTPIYSRCLLSYYLIGKVSLDRLRFRPDSFYDALGVSAHVGVSATKIDVSDNYIQLKNGRQFPFDKLLLATGARSKMPDIPGVNLDGVYPLRDLADVLNIKLIAESSRTAVILGGGLVGLKAAQALKKIGLDVKVVVRSGRLLSQMLDSQASEIYLNILNKSGIEMIPGISAAAFEGSGYVEKVIFDDGSKLDAQLVVVGKGVIPNSELLSAAGGNTDYGILVDDFLQTSLENIYAAGDVIETTDLARGEKRINAIWPCAAEQGRVAAENMCGYSRRYSGSMSMNSLEFFNVPVISMGIVSGNSPDYQEDIVLKPENNIYKKAVFKNDQLVGMVFVNAIDNAGVAGTLIKRYVDVSSIRNRILEDDFSYAHIRPLIKKQSDEFPEQEFHFIKTKG